MTEASYGSEGQLELCLSGFYNVRLVESTGRQGQPKMRIENSIAVNKIMRLRQSTNVPFRRIYIYDKWQKYRSL